MDASKLSIQKWHQRNHPIEVVGSCHGLTRCKGFVNERNIEEARAQSPNPALRNASIEEFYEGAVQDADIPRRLSIFK